MAHRTVLYHYPSSLYSQHVRLALAEKGASYLSRIVDIGPRMVNYEPWYMRINPRGVVPTLVIHGQIFTDTTHILHAIEAHLRGPALIPEDDEARRLMDAWIVRHEGFPFREMTYGRLPRVINQPLVNQRVKRLRHHLALNPELSQEYLAKIDDVALWRDTLADPQATDAIATSLERLLDDLDAHLTERRFIAGPRYSLADVIWTVNLARLVVLGRQHLIATRPALAAYYARVSNRPSFEEAAIWDHARPADVAPQLAAWAAPRLAIAAAIGVGGLLVWRALRAPIPPAPLPQQS